MPLTIIKPTINKKNIKKIKLFLHQIIETNCLLELRATNEYSMNALNQNHISKCICSNQGIVYITSYDDLMPVEKYFDHSPRIMVLPIIKALTQDQILFEVLSLPKNINILSDLNNAPSLQKIIVDNNLEVQGTILYSTINTLLMFIHEEIIASKHSNIKIKQNLLKNLQRKAVCHYQQLIHPMKY